MRKTGELNESLYVDISIASSFYGPAAYINEQFIHILIIISNCNNVFGEKRPRVLTSINLLIHN